MEVLQEEGYHMKVAEKIPNVKVPFFSLLHN